MNRSALVLLAAAALLLGGCYKSRRASPALHCPPWSADPDPVRLAPAKRLAIIDRCSGHHRHNRVPRSREDQRSYVLDTWLYLSLGLDYEAAGDQAAAARAFRTSLVMNGAENRSRPSSGNPEVDRILKAMPHTSDVRVELISRSERERLRAAAFDGLARVATAKGQTEYAQLLSSAAATSRAFVGSSEAVLEHTRFDAERKRVARAAKKAKAAKRWAFVAMLIQTAAAAQQQQDGQIDAAKAQELNRDALEAYQEADEAYRRVMEKVQATQERLTEAVLAESVAIDAERPIVTPSILAVLAGAKDRASVLPPLETAARSQPLLDAVTKARPQAGPLRDEELVELATALQSVELDVMRRERLRRKVASP